MTRKLYVTFLLILLISLFIVSPVQAAKFYSATPVQVQMETVEHPAVQ